MLQQYTDQIETIGLYAFYLLLFLLMGLSVQDVLKRSNVPKYGRNIVWAVLLFGCVGFIFKAIIEILWTNT
ncbi:hypothetical protein PCNPT3_03050 [Psychromonas sp. CNPT3]|uniref:DUF2788 domain-containing protein n=1 Tax=Psychromonas sp. CNPT3 TaxID=314282 RepID=UPI0002C0C774|nr:DUF2788 domain-containing protein [Psychromonas sp. CNPT3]AGH80552.1 hypothetical protein PCNPT3_03050 [Psychromonas sp. CNPT3]